jgi:hypothetical protein
MFGCSKKVNRRQVHCQKLYFHHVKFGLHYLVIGVVFHLASGDELLIEDMKHALDEELLISIRCRKYNIQKAFESVCKN